jgi:protein-L-isoaspartate O-methyltransferase
MAETYVRDIEPRFAPILEHIVQRAELTPGQHVLDLGTGTGTLPIKIAPLVQPGGRVTAVDISPQMLAIVERGLQAFGLANVTVCLADTPHGLKPGGFSVHCPNHRRDSPKALPAPLHGSGGVLISVQAHATFRARMPAHG